MIYERKKHVQDFIPDQNYISGLVTGLVAGVVVGLLFAPRSGKKLRKQIAGAVGDQAKEAKHKWDKTKKHTQEAIDDLKSDAGSVANKVSDKASEVADDLESGFNKAKSKFNLG